MKDPEQGQFKVVRENSGYSVQCTLPIYLPFSNFFFKVCGAAPLAGHHSINQIWACAHLFGTLTYPICKFLHFLMAILEAKNSQKNKKTFFTSFEKCEQQTHPPLNSWVDETCIIIHLENGYILEEKHG